MQELNMMEVDEVNGGLVFLLMAVPSAVAWGTVALECAIIGIVAWNKQ